MEYLHQVIRRRLRIAQLELHRLADVKDISNHQAPGAIGSTRTRLRTKKSPCVKVIGVLVACHADLQASTRDGLVFG